MYESKLVDFLKSVKKLDQNFKNSTLAYLLVCTHQQSLQTGADLVGNKFGAFEIYRGGVEKRKSNLVRSCAFKNERICFSLFSILQLGSLECFTRHSCFSRAE